LLGQNVVFIQETFLGDAVIANAQKKFAPLGWFFWSMNEEHRRNQPAH